MADKRLEVDLFVAGATTLLVRMLGSATCAAGEACALAVGVYGNASRWRLLVNLAEVLFAVDHSLLP